MNELVPYSLVEHTVGRIHALGAHEGERQLPGGKRPLGEGGGADSPRLASLEQALVIDAAGGVRRPIARLEYADGSGDVCHVGARLGDLLLVHPD